MLNLSLLNFTMNYAKGEKSDQNTREYDILLTNLNTYDKIIKKIALELQKEGIIKTYAIFTVGMWRKYGQWLIIYYIKTKKWLIYFNQSEKKQFRIKKI